MVEILIHWLDEHDTADYKPLTKKLEPNTSTIWTEQQGTQHQHDYKS